MNPPLDIEARRLILQAECDAGKMPEDRNRLGQFATPTVLATAMLECARKFLPPGDPVRFLDPGIGTGAFYSALLRTFPAACIAAAEGYEIDPHYARPAAELWRDHSLRLHRADFTRAEPSAERFNLVICNPPYVRHHHLEAAEKTRLRAATYRACGEAMSGLAGLYCHFLGIAHAWLAPGAVSGWLMPSEFMDVNYGRGVKRYLMDRVTLLRIHRFDPADVQFADALVSSAVVWFRHSEPAPGHVVEFTFGGTLDRPALSETVLLGKLRFEPKWTTLPHRLSVARSTGGKRLADFFEIRRGLATGDNSFFILTPEAVEVHDLPRRFLRPILPGPHYLRTDLVEDAGDGFPRVRPRLHLLDCRLPEREVAAEWPALWRYLQRGQETAARSYLCSRRRPWYLQESRPPPPFLCTYMGRDNAGRGGPFRFILNRSRATAANVYLLLYPKPALAAAMKADPGMAEIVWRFLQGIGADALRGEGRVYGGGLHKLEPRELANVCADALADLLPTGPIQGMLTL